MGRNNPAIDQVFLDDLLQHFRCAGMIPDSLGINDCNWPVDAHTQAIGLGPVNQWFGAAQLQFLEPLLQEFP